MSDTIKVDAILHCMNCDETWNLVGQDSYPLPDHYGECVTDLREVLRGEVVRSAVAGFIDGATCIACGGTSEFDQILDDDEDFDTKA